MTDRLRVGTRRSPLARLQTASVVDRLARGRSEDRFVTVPLDASGDRDRRTGGSPDFTDTLDRALLRGELDLAVHSAKDLPVKLDPRIVVAAYPRRADARDCLVVRSRDPRTAPLPRAARVGSSSPRRRAQLLRWRPDLAVVEIRGNVDTRIGLVRSGRLDGVILAGAGVLRLGRGAEIDRWLPTSAFLPAPAQGALAVVARTDDLAARSVAAAVDHAPTRARATAERAFAAALGGDCRLPVGALATVRAGTVSVAGEVLASDGRISLRRGRSGAASRAAAVGAGLGRALLEAGALALMRPGTP